MTEGIIIAIITGVTCIIGNALISWQGRVKDATERARLDERTAQRLIRIENKLDEHNGYADKITAISRDVAIIATKLEDVTKEK